MAIKPQDQQGSQQAGNQSGNQSGNVQGGSEQRSEGLLPAQGGDDGRFEVAEEVNLDQQSDKLRHVGQLPDDNADEANDQAADGALPDPSQQSDG